MRLEDEFGDVVRKARKGLGISEAELGHTGGLTPEQIRSIEDYSYIPDDGSISRIADALHLRANALVEIARDRYLPADPHLERWGCIAVIPSPYGDMVVNTFLVWDVKSRGAALFDTGTDLKAIREAVSANRLTVKLLCLTHTHGDHVAVLEDVLAEYSPHVIASPREPVSGAQFVHHGNRVKLGSLSIEVRETDGHSVGGLTFVISGFKGAPNVAVVGDALFAGSAGGAAISYDDLQVNIRDHIFSLPDDTLILPGHGPLTTVGLERDNNPFAP